MFSAFSWQLTEYQRPFRINAALAAVIHLQAPSTLMLVSFSLSVFDVCGRGLWIIKLVWYYQCWAFSAATFIRTPGLVISQHFINCTFCVLARSVTMSPSPAQICACFHASLINQGQCISHVNIRSIICRMFRRSSAPVCTDFLWFLPTFNNVFISRRITSKHNGR